MIRTRRGESIGGDGEWDVRVADNRAAKGWDELCQQFRDNAKRALAAIQANPYRRGSRQGRLIQRSLATKTVKGKVLDQWQYKVGASARIWYCIDEEEKTVWVTYASTRHPKATE